MPSISGEMWKAAAVLCAVVLGGCVTVDPPPLAPTQAKNPFAPVTVFVNPNEHVGAAHAELLEYIATRIETSGVFLRVDRGVQRWPTTLQLRHRWSYVEEPANTSARVGVWLTLGLIPMHVRKRHRLDVEVILEPEPVASLYYEEEAAAWVSWYTLARVRAADQAAADRLLERLLAELGSKRIVPRARDLTEPPPPPKKPRKQPV
jgi:hypothetical protein